MGLERGRLGGAAGVPPARQHAWSLENQLRRQGVSGSMIGAISRTGVRLIVDADLFAEADHDPVGPLERVRQPVLALWGEQDRVEPPAESARIVREALRRGGNEHHTIRFLPNAEHGLRASPDGFSIGQHFAPGYVELVTAWVQAVARGDAPGSSVAGPVPEQARLSRPLAPIAWWESAWVQLGALALPALAFASYLAEAFGVALARRVRKRAYATPGAAARRGWPGGRARLRRVLRFPHVHRGARGRAGDRGTPRPLAGLAGARRRDRRARRGSGGGMVAGSRHDGRGGTGTARRSAAGRGGVRGVGGVLGAARAIGRQPVGDGGPDRRSRAGILGLE